MAVPNYQEFMLPILKVLQDGKEHPIREIRERVAEAAELTDEDRKELLPSGIQRVFENRTSWACTYLKKAGLIQSKKRGNFIISPSGLTALDQEPDRIDIDFLKQFKEFNDFLLKSSGNGKNGITVDPEETTAKTPDEVIDEQFARLNTELASDLLKRVKECSPAFFEQLVVDLLVKMGYGGSRKEAGQATRASVDEGIDGIIKEDRLGLDVIYIQAKRWEGVVSRPELQKFAGALQGQRAKKGIFITTSSFSAGAIDFCRHLDSKIILIDGEQLAILMIDFNVGVSVQRTLEIKRLDSDFFTAEET